MEYCRTALVRVSAYALRYTRQPASVGKFGNMNYNKLQLQNHQDRAAITRDLYHDINLLVVSLYLFVSRGYYHQIQYSTVFQTSEECHWSGAWILRRQTRGPLFRGSSETPLVSLMWTNRSTRISCPAYLPSLQLSMSTVTCPVTPVTLITDHTIDREISDWLVCRVPPRYLPT